MKIIFASVAAFVITAPLAVSAATINFNSYASSASLSQARTDRDAFMGNAGQSEEFEELTACTNTNVATCNSGTITTTSFGTFTGITPSITNGGSQVAPKDAIVVRNSQPDPYGRFNTTDGGNNWLDSNDMAGILWTLSSAANTFFEKISFFLTDVDDVGSIKFNIGVNGATPVDMPGNLKLSDGALHLVSMDFTGEDVSTLNISMINGKGDGFGFDSAQVNVRGTSPDSDNGPSPVPVPAAGLMLFGALGGLVAMRRRRKA